MNTTRILLTLLIAALSAAACSGEPDKKNDKPPELTGTVAPGDCAEGVPLGDLFSVWQLLMAFDNLPEASAFEQAAKDPAAALILLSSRGDLTPAIRSRAVDAMSLVPDERVRAVLSAAIDDVADDTLRHAAINDYARAWPSEACARLDPVLTSDPDPQIRLTAAAALSAFAGAEGHDAVSRAADAETEDWVKEKMKGYAGPKKPKPMPNLP